MSPSEVDPEGPHTPCLRLLLPKSMKVNHGFWNQQPQTIGALEPLGKELHNWRLELLAKSKTWALTLQEWPAPRDEGAAEGFSGLHAIRGFQGT